MYVTADDVAVAAGLTPASVRDLRATRDREEAPPSLDDTKTATVDSTREVVVTPSLPWATADDLSSDTKS